MHEQRASNWSAIGVAAIAPIVVAMVLVAVRDDVINANIALVLMAVVVLVAAGGGRAAGMVAAVSAAVSFDFFHTEPYLSLTIDSQDDVETVLILLAVGLVVGTVAARARASRAAHEAGKAEIARIHDLAERVARGTDAGAVIEAAQVHLRELLGLRGCRFEAPPFATALVRLERTGALTATGERLPAYHLGARGFELPAAGAELPVLSRGRPVGRFVLEPTPGVGSSLEERVVAVALADQVGAAIALQGSS